MDRSQYLAQALQAMGSAPPSASAPAMDLGAMKASADQRRAWEAANPGKSHLKHSIGQAGGALAGAPGAALSNLSSLLGMGARK